MKLAIIPIALSIMIMGQGCIMIRTYNGPKPLEPKPAYFKPLWYGTSLATLRPHFEWRATHPGAEYDFAIWEYLLDIRGEGKGAHTGAAAKGPLVYSKKLHDTKLDLDMDLVPENVYCWSVREAGGEWMSLNQWLFVMGSYEILHCHPFVIRTTKQDDSDKP